MKPVLQRLAQDPDKSFVVYHEKEPFFSCPWHYHPEYQLVLVTKSSGERIVGDHIGYFKEGDLVFIGTQLPHVYDNDPIYSENISGLYAEAIVIQFHPDFLGNELFKAPEFQTFLRFLENSNQGMEITGATSLRIAGIMKAMPGMDGLQRLVSLFSIFSLLSESSDYKLLASAGFMRNFDISASTRVKKVTEYVMRNFRSDITLEMIAGVASMTPTNFCAFFKKYYRQTFVGYLHDIRVGYACKLLGELDKNISEIAYASGFKNMSNFNRQFKKIKGVSPAEYRQSLSRKVQAVPNNALIALLLGFIPDFDLAQLFL